MFQEIKIFYKCVISNITNLIKIDPLVLADIISKTTFFVFRGRQNG